MKFSEVKIIAAIADVHIGNKAISHNEYKYQLKNGVIDKLSKMQVLDGLVLCGDTLHYQISMNSEYADVFHWFISELIKICKKNNAFMRVIKGTKSHDLEQLETIRHYEKDFDIDFKIINDYLIEEIDGIKYCYIAENYIKGNIYEYYKDIFNREEKYFDMIFMHGMIEPCRFFSQDSENLDTNAPVFSLKEFYKICKGPIIGGHIHTPMVFNNKFYYVGSTLRTCHGEEEPKGWNIIGYIPATSEYVVEKIINEFTFNFSTIKLKNDFIKSKDADAIVKYVEKYYKDNDIDKLSVKVKCIDSESNNLKLEMLRKYFSKNPNISFSIKMLSEASYEKEDSDMKVRETKPYLKEGLDLVERIRLWAQIEANKELTSEQILRYITPKNLERKGIKDV